MTCNHTTGCYNTGHERLAFLKTKASRLPELNTWGERNGRLIARPIFGPVCQHYDSPHLSTECRQMEREFQSGLTKLHEAGLCFHVEGHFDWSLSTVLHCLEYQQRTGYDPVEEFHAVKSFESYFDDGNSLACESDIAVIERMQNIGGAFAVSDRAVSGKVQFKSWLENERSYENRRRLANQAIANKETRSIVFERDSRTCRNCGSQDQLAIDHIVSVKNGGGNEVENLQILCQSCNSSKGAK